MSDAWKGVSRARKCPICQHEDWCGYWTPEDSVVSSSAASVIKKSAI